MTTFSSALQWWEDWQLRVLALSSLGAQCYLALFASARKKHNKPLFRFSIWLAYLGGDALAMYGLAILFNRQRKLQYSSRDGSHHGLELLWAPILLWHLGGQINISAYNIEDNELWRRHVLTTASQITVAIYVFCKSWSSSADKRLLAAAILLFIIGIFKCIDKTSSLKRASFNTIVATFHPALRSENTRELELEQYIQEAKSYVQDRQDPPNLELKEQIKCINKLSIPDKLFVDYSYLYQDRQDILKSFWLLDNKATYDALSQGLSETFDLIYTKRLQWGDHNRDTSCCSNACSFLNRFIFYPLLPIVPIALFHASHKQAYRGSDIKVTFSLLYFTYFSEILSFITRVAYSKWSHGVAQYSLIGLLAWKRRHTRLMGIAKFFHCKCLLDAYFSFKPCHSPKEITKLVREHAEVGWMNHITDIESYWRFSDSRGQCTLERNRGEEILLAEEGYGIKVLHGSIEKPFDESIILWHVATDICFHMKDITSHGFQCARMCRQISNYMMHLLFSNPEALLPGSRRNLFTDAYDELEDIVQGGDDLSQMDERELTLYITSKAESAKVFQDSWVLAQVLMRFGDSKMWEVIKDVWIEMLCFSAGRCRGYLHAKSLGSGGEYLSYVSLLMSHAGLETYAERQQRVQLQLSKEERVKIAKERNEEAAKKRAAGGSSTPQSVVPVKDEEIATIPLASQANGQLEQEDVASTSASGVGCDAPASAIEIVVPP